VGEIMREIITTEEGEKLNKILKIRELVLK
jgi:hypothetical protein